MTISFSGLASGLDTSSWIQSLLALRQAKVTTYSAQKEKLSVSQNTLSNIKSYFSTFRSTLEKLTDAKFGISTMDLFTQNLATTTNMSAFTAVATTEAEENSYDVKVKKLATNTKANSRYITHVTTKTTAIKESTLEDIGMTSGKVMFKVGGVDRGVVLDSSDTISTFIDKLEQIGVSASYNEASGAFNINVSVSDITDKGNTGIIDKMHLSGVNEGYQSTNKFQVVETRETVNKAELSTKISDLDTGITINNGDYVHVKNSSGEIFNISVNENTTINDFVTSLTDAGLFAKFDTEEAKLQISGGEIIGGTFDAITVFGLKDQAYSAMSTGNQLSETVIVPDVVTLQTRLVEDLGVTRGYMEITKPDGTLYYEKIGSGQTMGDLMADLGNLGINSSLDSETGMLRIVGGEFRTLSESEVNDLINQGKIAESDANYKKGTSLLNALGINDGAARISYAEATSQALTFRKTDVAYTDDLISHYIDIPANNQIVVHQKTGEEIGTVTVSSTSSFENLFGELAQYGIDGQIHDGRIMIDSANGLYITGDVVSAMGIETTYETTVITTTVGKSQTTAEKTFNRTQIADATSMIKDFVTLSSSNNQIVVKDHDGNATNTVTVTNSMSFGDLFNTLAPMGVIGQMNDGVLTLVHNDGGYVDGNFTTAAMGMSTFYGTVITTTTVGSTQTTSGKSFNVVDVADENSVINNFLAINSTNNKLVAKDANGNVKGTITLTNSMTFKELFASLAPLGVDGDIEDGQLTLIDNNGGYVDGSFASAMGISTTYKTVTTTTTVGGVQTTSAKTYTKTDVADADSIINDFLTINNNSNKIVIRDANGSATNTVTVTNTMSFRDLFTTLASKGVYGGIQDGKLTLYESNGGYVDGNFVSSMGMTTNYTTVYTTSTIGQSSTGSAYSYTETLDATGSTTFRDIGSTGNKTWYIVNGQSGATVASGTTADTTTIGQFADILGQYGFTAGIDGGYFTCSSPQGYYVKGTAADALGLKTESYIQTVHGTATNTIAATTSFVVVHTVSQSNTSGKTYITQTVNVTAHQTITVDTTSTRTVTANKSSTDHNTYTRTTNMNGNTKLSQVGLGDGTFTVVHNGTVGVVSIKGSSTVDSIIGQLGAYGIEASVSASGAMTFEGTSDGYIIGATGSAVSLGAKGTYTTSTTSVVHGVTSASARKTRNITGTMVGETTLANLGLAGGTATVNYQGKDYTISMGTTNTMDDFMTALSGYGISASISDGKMTVQGTADGYILSTSGGISSLGIGTSTIKSTSTVVNGVNTAANRKIRTVTQSMTSDTTLAQLGWAGGNVTGVYHGQSFTVSMQTNNSIGDLISALAARGISGTVSADGKLTLTGSADGYITGATGGLSGSLGIVASKSESTSTKVYGLTSAALQKSRSITYTMTGDTTFADLGLGGGTAKVNYQGNDYNLVMNASSTMNDFMTALSGYGISASIKDGKMTVTGTNDGYVLSTTGGVKDLGIKTSTVKTSTTVVEGDNGLSTTLIRTTNPILNRSTKLVDLQDADGNNLGITAGSYYIYENGVRYTQSITAETTVNDLLSQLSEYNILADIHEDGTIVVSGDDASYLATSSIGGVENSNLVSILFNKWDFTKVYDSNDLSIPTPEVRSITRDTKLNNISEGANLKEGIVTVVKDGIQINLYVNENDTVGTFMDELSMHGFETALNDNGQLIVKASGNSRLQDYSVASEASNVLDILGVNSNNWIQTNSYESKQENIIRYHDEFVNATEDTLLSSLDNGGNALESYAGSIEIMVDGVKNTISVNENESVGSLLNKFRELGLEATISDGQVLIQSGYKNIQINESNSTSAIGRSNTGLGLTFKSDFGGYASSSEKIISTTYQDNDISVSNWADMNTSLASLNITAGSLSVYRDGQKAQIYVTSDDTFETLQNKISDKLSDVRLSFENGYLKFSSIDGKEVSTGSSTDTSNFASITGVKSVGMEAKSSRELFKVNADSVLTDANLFREAQITEGTFNIGDATFTIDSSTTLNDIVSMINNTEESGAYAYWDSIDGKLYLESKLSGAMYVNVEKGTSNFTDVMGLTVTDKNTNQTTMNIDAQEVGTNAEFTINGTTYTSNSNTINSDISRIKGVTLYLKNISTDEETATVKEETLTVEKDRESLANAVSDVVDAYNELMTNVDQTISAEGDLKDQTSLKMIRNQLRSLMTSSMLGLSSLRNLDAIGISVDKASGGNISTSNVTNLTFDRDKFNTVFNSDPTAVKSLLIGTDTDKGILTKIEDLVESTLTSVSGYFDTQNSSYLKQMQQIDERIAKENRSTLRYQEILESKFSAMDLLISQMQQQYSSFLST